MTYTGRIENGAVVLEGDPALPEGASVTLEVLTPAENQASPGGDAPKGSARAILEALCRAPRVSKEDVDEMERMIEEGKLPARYDNPFPDEEE